MKKRIIIITLVLILAGTAVLGFDIINLTPDEAYEAASQNDIQHEIDELNIVLKEAGLTASQKNASYTALNSYQGNITKYISPFDAETSLMISEMNLAKSEKQLMVTILSTMLSLYDSRIAYDDSVESYEDAKAAYNEGISNSAISATELLSLEYTAENNRIKMLQAENTLTKRQTELDRLLGVENAAVELPVEYTSPYSLDKEEVYNSMIETDISLFQAKRAYESAKLRHETAAKFYDEDEEIFISTLSALMSSELSYNKKLQSIEDNVIDRIDQLKTMYDSIELEKLNVEIKESLYNASMKQYAAGIISVNSLDSAKKAYNLALMQLDSKIYDYIITCMQFTIDTGHTF